MVIAMEEPSRLSRLKGWICRPKPATCIFAAVVVVWLGVAQLIGAKSFIVVDGKPVVCVGSVRDAEVLLRDIKREAGVRDISEVQFRQDVTVSRAPRNARIASRHKAARVLHGCVVPVVSRWAVIVDGRPAVAVPDKQTTGQVLDLAKLRFGSRVKNLAEEPQFKESVSVEIAAVEPSIYCRSAEEAVEMLFAPRKAAPRDALYEIKKGDIAGAVAERHGIKLAELWAMNPGVNLHKLQIGDVIKIKSAPQSKPRLTVVVRDLVERIETMPPPVLKVCSARIISGDSARISPGRPGLRRVKIATVYENGVKVGREILEEEVLREPTPRQIAVGIKPAR